MDVIPAFTFSSNCVDDHTIAYLIRMLKIAMNPSIPLAIPDIIS